MRHGRYWFAIAFLLAGGAVQAETTWWSLRPLSDAQPPQIRGGPAEWAEWASHPIDRFVYARLAERGLSPNPPASKRSLIRRATYDLTGLPPTPEEVAEFLDDTSPGAYERLIDRLLASPRYGERWGRHWLDVVRFGESNGFERNVLINNLWPFRDYVIRSLNEDKPFDQLVREHLAGDVVGQGDREVEVGTAFLVCGPYDNVGNQDPQQAAQIRANTIDEMIRATTEAFLGLTVGCARCHDHKFDPIGQADYYALYATFAGVEHGSRGLATPEEKQDRAARLEPLEQHRSRLEEQKAALQQSILDRARQKATDYANRWVRPPVDRRGTEEVFPPVSARYVRLVVEGQEQQPSARTGYNIEEFEIWTAGETPRNVALASAGASAKGRSRTADDFAGAYSAALTIDGETGARWIASGPELTIKLARPSRIGRVLFYSDKSGQAGDHPVANFVCEYRLLVSLDGKEWTEIANSHDRRPVNPAHENHRLRELEIRPDEREALADLQRQIEEVDHEIADLPNPPEWWVGRFHEAPGPFHVFLGGSPQRKGPEVVPSSLSALADVVPPYALGDDSPEAERRLALAEWLVHPDNPLTPRVLANRLWHYHFGRGIVATPSDFGAMGGLPSHPELLDWLARQIHKHQWRLKPLHRLIMTSQTYRQSCAHRAEAAETDADARFLWRFPPRRLSAEEIRDTLLAISGRLDPQMGGPGFRLYRYLEDNVATYVPLDRPGPETYRRSVYHQNARACSVDLLTDFDSPDCARAAPRRDSTTSPMQALTMLNHQFTLDMANYLAMRIEGEVGAVPADQVRRAFALAYCRSPGEEELCHACELIEDHGLAAFCRVLFNTNELIYVH